MSSSNRSSSVRIGGDGQLLGSEAQHAAGRHRRQGLRVERGGQRRGHDLGVGLQRGAREAGWWGCRPGPTVRCLFGEDPRGAGFVRGPGLCRSFTGTCGRQLSLYQDPGLNKVLPGPTVV